MKHLGKIAMITAGLGMVSVVAVATKGVLAQSTPSTPVDSAVISSTSTVATTTPAPSITDRHQAKLDAMAKLLGITSSQLQTERQNGKQLYQIAAEHGVTYDQVKADAEAQYKARLDDMVKVGYITAQEEATFLQQYQTQSQSQPMDGMMGFEHHREGF